MINGRTKGARAENDICYLLTAWWMRIPLAEVRLRSVAELPFRRRFTTGMPLSGDWSGAGDILSANACAFCYCVEVKKRAGWTLDGMLGNPRWIVWDWWQQCRVQAAGAKSAPMLLFSRNNSPWLVMTHWSQIPSDSRSMVMSYERVAIFSVVRLPQVLPR